MYAKCIVFNQFLFADNQKDGPSLSSGMFYRVKGSFQINLGTHQISGKRQGIDSQFTIVTFHIYKIKCSDF